MARVSIIDRRNNGYVYRSSMQNCGTIFSSGWYMYYTFI